jgi:hypothetical protein
MTQSKLDGPPAVPSIPPPGCGRAAVIGSRLGRYAAAIAVVMSLLPVVVLLPTGAAAASRFVGPGVSGFGDAPNVGGIGGAPLSAPAVALAGTADGRGYWVAAADGEVFSFGDAKSFGSAAAFHLYAPIVGMAATPDGGGYWLVAMDGGIFSFGNARFYGSTGGIRLNQPIVAIASSPTGRGYWLIASDGGIFSFGDARFHGSTGGIRLSEPIRAAATTPSGGGYWLVASDGGVFTFGDAAFHGSAVNQHIGTWITGIATTRDGGGYWLAAATGGVLSFGNAVFKGPSPNLPPFSPTAAIAATPDSGGYWLLRPLEAGQVFANPPSSSPFFPGGGAAVAAAASQIGPNLLANNGAFCNPYGPCEAWCALFATWAWNQAGIPIPRFAFTGDVFNWTKAHGQVLPATARPVPGDGVMFGTGPQNTSTSVHMGIVAQVWPNGAIDVIEGDSGPEPSGRFAVTVDGPFLPAFSAQENGMGIYAFVRP